MALPFNGDFLLLETSLDKKPEGKAASHLQVANCFSCISSRSPEHGCLVPGGNRHSMTPPWIWGDLVRDSVPLAVTLHPMGNAPGSPPHLHNLGNQPLPPPSTARAAGTALSPPFVLAKAGSRHRAATQASPKHTGDSASVN